MNKKNDDHMLIGHTIDKKLLKAKFSGDIKNGVYEEINVQRFQHENVEHRRGGSSAKLCSSLGMPFVLKVPRDPASSPTQISSVLGKTRPFRDCLALFYKHNHLSDQNLP